MVYYEIPYIRSLFMPSIKMKIPSICAFSTTHSLKIRKLNRGFATSLKKLTRPFCITNVCNYDYLVLIFKRCRFFHGLRHIFSITLFLGSHITQIKPKGFSSLGSKGSQSDDSSGISSGLSSSVHPMNSFRQAIFWALFIPFMSCSSSLSMR